LPCNFPALSSGLLDDDPIIRTDEEGTREKDDCVEVERGALIDMEELVLFAAAPEGKEDELFFVVVRAFRIKLLYMASLLVAPSS